MKWFFSMLLSFLSVSSFAQEIYQSATFVLHLKADSSFIYYPKEASLKSLVAGEYLMQGDSLLLTTHKYNRETVIFAIYAATELELKLLYTQNEYRNSLSQRLYLHQTLYPNQKIKDEYFWSDYTHRNYEHYKFSPEGYRLSVKFVLNGFLEGKQLYFYPTRDNKLQMEAHYKEGKLHGKLFYYEPVKDHKGKLALVKKDKYKKGRLVKSKTPAAPPIFYTNHF